MIYESPSTPIALARYLATYISDDSTILAHVRHRFGVTLSRVDMAKMRASLPKKYLPGQGNPSGGTLSVIEAFAVTFAVEQTIRCLLRWHLTT